jgi:hypothetical protein
MTELTTGTTDGFKAVGNDDDAEYEAFLARLQKRFLENTGNGKRPLFVTHQEDLFPNYLMAFDGDRRQFHNCSACKSFVRRFGSLVVIDEDGSVKSAFWDEEDAPEEYKPAVREMIRWVTRSPVSSPFYSAEAAWGQAVTGTWRHMALEPSRTQVYRGRVLSAGQLMAEKREDYNTLSRALSEFTLDHIEQAVVLLKSESLYRSEKVLGAAEWLGKLHRARAAAKGLAKQNVTWLAVASAPTGYCHPKSSMIGTLLEDLAAGMPFTTVAKRFADKMHPLQYQRPQAAPSAGNIKEAERLFETLGLARSLERRFARIDELQLLWQPRASKAAAAEGGVFSHLKPKGSKAAAKPLNVPASNITWEKFRRTVLPEAEQITLLPPSYGAYTALVTAVHSDAPPILQWDLEEARNPFSWYLYHGGSTAAHWGLPSSHPVQVTGITLQPNMWGPDEDKFKHQGKGVVFLLEGARESKSSNLCLFPEILKSELHAVRSTIEAHSKSASIEGKEEGSACGLIMQSGKIGRASRNDGLDATIEVTTGGQRICYRIDRWD